LRRKVDQLQAALEKSRGDLETTRKEKQAANTRLDDTSAKLENAQKEIATSKDSERQARDQLAQTQASLKALQSSQENSTMEQLRAENAHLKDAVAVAEEARATAERQRDETNAKLAEANQQIASVEQQRDEAIAQLQAGSETERHTETLFADNGDVKLMLANAKDNVHGLDQGNSANAEELMGVQQKLTGLQQQLAESQKRNQYLVARIAELWVQLDEAATQLQSAKLSGKHSEETDPLVRENELLRNIVVREREEEARRDDARKSMLAELDRLKIKSDALNKQIELLAHPVTKLSTEELGLLRQPVVSVSDQNPGVLTASFIFAKKSAGDSVEAAGSNANNKSDPDGEATTNSFGPLKGDAQSDRQISGNPRHGSE
jgi:chromosome segregation ATPase